ETLPEMREQGEGRHPEDAKPLCIAEDVWPSCRPALGDPILRAGQMGYFINASCPDDVQEVSLAYGKWISRLEEAHIAVERVPPDQARACRGRAHGHSIKRVKASTTPGRAHTVDAGVELWSTLTTLAIRARALVANKTDSDQLDYVLGDLEQRCDTIADEDALLASIGDDFHLMSSSDLIGALDPFIEVSERWASRALGRSHAKARRGFIKWAKESWKSKAGVVYRHVREPQVQQTEVLLRDTAVADPCSIMRLKTEAWEKVWSDPEFDEGQVPQDLGDLRARAAEDPLEPITLERLDVVLSRTSSKRAKGIDNITALDIARCPPSARQQLVDLLSL
ncbi:unnamed protein product, partial [Prorocentrum cordatum]